MRDANDRGTLDLVTGKLLIDYARVFPSLQLAQDPIAPESELPKSVTTA